MISRYAILSAIFFVAFEGTFWKGGILLWQGEWFALLPLVLSTVCFAFFVTYTAKEVRGDT